MTNNLVLVDIFDNEVGYMEKISTHKAKRLHRAFSLFVINGSKMLIQKRAAGKYHSGGLWANACCSHPRQGEDLVEAVISRAKDEIGIEITEPKKLFDFIYYSEYNNGITEYELDNVFLVEYSGAIIPNPEEVDEVKWIGIDELAQDLIDNPSKYCTWFLNCAPRVIKYLKGKNIF